MNRYFGVASPASNGSGIAVPNPLEPAWLPWTTAVAMGKLPGVHRFRKFGFTAPMQTAGATYDMWNFSDVEARYTFLDQTGTTRIDSVSSSSAADAGGLLAVISGIVDDGTSVTQTIALTGQTRAAIPIPYIRTNRIVIIDPRPGRVGAVGDVYVYQDATTPLVGGVPASAQVRSYVAAGDNQTQQAIYSTPKDCFCMLTNFKITQKSRDRGVMSTGIRIRSTSPTGAIPSQLKIALAVAADGTSAIAESFYFPIPLPDSIDLTVSVIPDTSNTAISGEFELIEFDRNIHPDLPAIGA